jgi:error-prone DNA polymerase
MQLAVVAAGFTPGEADQLRRAMASWKQKGHVERFKHKLREGMRAAGHLDEFAERLCRQIEGFGEYGFPESHAASFALLAYVSAWLKCHEPAIFLCALLNSQPMGFYQPAQLIHDARRHGVEVRAIDVQHSAVDAGIEDGAVRLGLASVSGLARASAERIVCARRASPFADANDLARRARLDAGDLHRLASADALRSLAGHRHQAAWQATGIALAHDLIAAAPAPEQPLQLAAPSEGADILGDYASTGFTPRRHPLALLRPRLAERRFQRAAEIAALNHEAHDRAPGRAAGIVTSRQRPGTAKSVFVTLEDESGCVNVIVHPWLAEKQRSELLGARLLGVYGQLQAADNVVHIIAKRLVDLTPWLGALPTASRDFH